MWEWCSSLFKNYPYDPADGREDLEGDGARVLRGGSFLNASGLVRCAFRFRDFPDSWNYYVGFRLVVARG